jgi:hypothetical protein
MVGQNYEDSVLFVAADHRDHMGLPCRFETVRVARAVVIASNEVTPGIDTSVACEYGARYVSHRERGFA